MSDVPKSPDWEGFGRDLLDDWPVRDIDGAELFEAALSNGLIREIAGGFDPDKHIDAEGLRPDAGDPWYEYAFGNTRTIPSPDALIRAALKAAADQIRWEYNTVKDGKLTWACESIRALADDPEAVAQIIQSATDVKAAEGRG